MSENKQYENGVAVIEIDRNVSAVAAAFGFLQDLLSRFLETKSCTPSAHVVAAASAEHEQLVPVLFHKEQDLADDIFLFCLVVTESIAIDVNVQTASTGLMGTVAPGNRFQKECFPVHFLYVIIQRHGVTYDFKTIFQAAI